MSACLLCRIRGKVQGVWFRAGTRRQAQLLGITGYAHNRPDGGVEVLACGPAAALEALRRWLWQGPPEARVDEVVCEEVAVAPPDGFTTG